MTWADAGAFAAGYAAALATVTVAAYVIQRRNGKGK